MAGTEGKAERWVGMGKVLASPLYAVAAPLLIAVAIWGGSHVPFLLRIENVTIDARFRARADRDGAVDERLLVVGIMQSDLEDFGRWPWKRAVHGDLMTLLAHKKPAVIAYDVLYTEQQGDGSEDQYMADAAAQLGEVVVGAYSDVLRKRAEEEEEVGEDGVGGMRPAKMNRTDFGRTKPITNLEGDLEQLVGKESAILPRPELAAAAYIGFADAQPSVDGVFRRLQMVVRVGEEVYPTLVTQTLMRYWGIGPESVRLELGKVMTFETGEGEVEVPIDGSGFCLINWRNEVRFLEAPATTSFSYARLAHPLIKTLMKGEPWPEDRPEPEGKIVLVGIAQPEGLIDLGASPYNPQSPKMLAHANVINNVLQGDYLRPVNFWWALAAWVVVSMGTLLFLRKSSIGLTVLVPLLLTVVYVVVSFLVFARGSVVFPLAWPVLGFVALHGGAVTARWMQEAGAREVIKGMFSSYIGPDIMEHLLDRPDLVNLGGERKPVTVFFSDIRSFTTMSEGMDVEELVVQLNEYFEKMVDCVNRNQGTLHKYIGDAIMAVWGDVNWRGVYQQTPAETAQNAVRASLSMMVELKGLQEEWQASGRPVFTIGIGLNHGQAVVGDIGATQRREFTVMGDTVNTASRLEGFTKKFGVDIVVSESVKELLGDRFLTRSLGLVAPKGKTQAVRLYEVLGNLDAPTGEAPSPDTVDWVRRHEEGFELFLAGDYEGALGGFEGCAEERPGNLVCERYLEVCRGFVERRPEAGWKTADVFAEEAKSK